MFQLFISLKESTTNFIFSFKDANICRALERHIREQRQAKEDSMVIVEDSYGHIGSFMAFSILGCLVTDISQELDSEIEKKIIGTRANAKFQQKLQADPVLKLHAANAMAAGVQQ